MVFGSLAAILVAVTDLSLVEVMAIVGVCVAVMAAIVTVVVLFRSGLLGGLSHVLDGDATS